VKHTYKESHLTEAGFDLRLVQMLNDVSWAANAENFRVRQESGGTVDAHHDLALGNLLTGVEVPLAYLSADC
jgi:hypothetical protein